MFFSLYLVVQKILSIAEDLAEGAQDEEVNVQDALPLFGVVPNREDLVLCDPSCPTDLLNLNQNKLYKNLI